MKRTHRGKSYFHMVASYLLISIVPIVFVGTVFIMQQNRIEHTATLSHYESNVIQATTTFDRVVDDIYSIGQHFSSEYQSGILDDVGRIQRQFVAYKESFNLSGDLFYFARADQTVYSIDGPMPYIQFEATHSFGTELNMASFYSKINTSVSGSYFPSRDVSGESHYFIYLQPVPLLNNTPEGTLIYIMPNEAIRQSILESMDNFNGCFSVFTSDHRSVYTLIENSDITDELFNRVLNPIKGTNWQMIRIEGEEYEVYRRITDGHGYSYTVAFPAGWMFRNESGVKWKYIGLLLGFTLLAAVSTLILAWRQHRSTRDIVKTLYDDEAEMDDGEMLTAIDRGVKRLRNENESLIVQLQSYTDEARTRFLSDVVDGKVSDPDALTLSMKTAGITFPDRTFAVMVFLIAPTSSQAFQDLPERMLSEIDFAQGRAYALPIHMKDRIALIINTSEDDEQSLIGIAGQFRARLEKMGFSTAGGYGISSARSDILRVNRQLFEAFAALENKTAVYEMNSMDSLQRQILNVQLYRQYLQYRNEEGARQALLQILDQLDERRMPIDRRQALYFNLINALVMASVELDIPLDTSDLTVHASAANQEAFEAAVLSRTEWLLSQADEAEAVREKDLNHRIIEYIYERFSDNKLSLDMVADAFHVSVSTVRKFIRDATGATFSNYITTVRMTHAKKLLTETELPIKEIVEKCGYIDVSSFTRKFKAMEGVTPSQYRATMQMSAPTEE